MTGGTRKHFGWIRASILSGAIFFGVGCQNSAKTSPGDQAPSDQPVSDRSAQTSFLAVAQTPAQTPGVPGQGQPEFATDDDAMNAMMTAVKNLDHDEVHHILGPAWKELVSSDKVEDGNAFKDFAKHAAEQTRLEKKDATISIIYIGKADWPFPIPIAKAPDGKWFFDTEAGKEEILARRIGANELNTIQICHEYVQAQREYASKDRDDSGVLKYAQKIISTPGKMDGLYWTADAGQEQSPLGPLMAQAGMEGYEQAAGHSHEPYHGYHFCILKEQGPDAPGGQYNYVINGNMIAGFALVAFPAEYGQSGIMTFIVSHLGKVYQKDLGPQTKDIAWHMTAYNPDASWTLVKE